MANQFHTVLLDSADEAFYRQYGAQDHIDHTSHSTSYLSPDACDFDGNEDENEDDEDDGNDDDMDFDDLDGFRWLDDDEDLDLRLDDYHHALAETSRKPVDLPPRQSSLRRRLSMNAVSFHRRSSSTSVIGHPTSQPTIGPSSPSDHVTNVVTRHQKRASTSSLDPAATYYQDPAARMKLRLYLASPQKFDEAIEFGFPSLQLPHTMSSRPRTSPGSSVQEVHTFFHDDTPSLSADDDTDGKSLSEGRQSPCTPQDATFTTSRWSEKSSSEKSHPRPSLARVNLDTYAHVPASSREMTLHMTLTRPDLRSPEDACASRQKINATPIEHAPLTVLRDVGSIWDTLPEEPSKVKRFFKKFHPRR